MVMVLTRRAAKCAEDSYIGASSLRASASLRETFIPQTLADDNYLQIADNSGNRYLWDPSEPIATRPLVWLHGGNTYSYTHDGNKNVSELIDDNGAVTAHYEYAPFGDVTVTAGNLASANRFRFSSEYADDALGLVYYNYRHYEPVTGRWMSHDPVEFLKLMNNYPPSNVMGFTILLDTFILDYNYLFNSPLHTSDYLGLYKVKKCFIDIFLGHNTKTDKQEFAYVPKQIETGSCGAASAHTCYSDNIKIYVNRIAQGVSGAISISKGVADADRAFQQAENQWATKLCNASDENGNSCCCKKISISIKCQFGLDIMSRAAVSKGICGKHVDVICGEK